LFSKSLGDFDEDLKMTVQIAPLHDRVLVRRLEEKETRKAASSFPTRPKRKPQEGEVIAVGAERSKKGQRVRST